MRSFPAQLIDSNGKPIAEITAWVEYVPGESQKQWRGSFNSPASFGRLSDSTYRLKLSDGRSGNIIITYASYADGARGSFQGTGPLTRMRA